VTHLPDRRLDEVAPWSEHLGVGQAVEQLELDRAGVLEGGDQGIGAPDRAEIDHRRQSTG
jgi:hypothetical protein